MQSLVLLLWLALCAEQDVRERQIANTLTFGAALFALAYLFLTGHTWIGAEPADAAVALVLVMVLTLPGYILGRLGAGDVKLLGALALATDQWYLLGTFIGAGVALIAWLLGRRWLWSLLNQKLKKRLREWQEQMTDRQPFAPFLLSGFLLAIIWIH